MSTTRGFVSLIMAMGLMAEGCHEPTPENLCKVEQGGPVDFGLPQSTTYGTVGECTFNQVFSRGREAPGWLYITFYQSDATGTNFESFDLQFAAPSANWKGGTMSVYAYTPGSGPSSSFGPCAALPSKPPTGVAAVCLQWYSKTDANAAPTNWEGAQVLPQGSVEVGEMSVPFDLNESGKVRIKLNGLVLKPGTKPVNADLTIGLYVVEQPPFSQF